MNNLAQILNDKDLTQAALARAVGKTPAHIHNIVNCKWVPGIDLALAIAAALDVDVRDIWPSEVKSLSQDSKQAS